MRRPRPSSLLLRSPKSPSAWPVEPADAPRDLVVQKGFALQLAAGAERRRPGRRVLDADGRLHVAEMQELSVLRRDAGDAAQAPGKKNACRVTRLVDTDGTGCSTRAPCTPTRSAGSVSVCCYDDGVFARRAGQAALLQGHERGRRGGYPPRRARRVQPVQRSGARQQHEVGLDNRITASGGTTKSQLKQDGKDLGPLSLRDWSLDPKTGAITLVTGGQRVRGIRTTTGGTGSSATTAIHIQHVVYPREALDREGAGSPFHRSARSPSRSRRRSFRTSPQSRGGSSGPAAARPIPRFRNRLPATELVATGFFTSATGVTIYRGDAYPADFRGTPSSGTSAAISSTARPCGRMASASRPSERTRTSSSSRRPIRGSVRRTS